MTNRIKELRIKHGLSQKELADRIGIKNNALCQYEKGKRNPKNEMWKYLADYFDVSVPYIRGEIDTELIAKIAEMAFYLLEPTVDLKVGGESLPEKGKKGAIGILLIALINQLGLNTEDIVKELSFKMGDSDFASMINSDSVEGLTEAGLKLANSYDEL